MFQLVFFDLLILSELFDEDSVEIRLNFYFLNVPCKNKFKFNQIFRESSS